MDTKSRDIKQINIKSISKKQPYLINKIVIDKLAHFIKYLGQMNQKRRTKIYIERTKNKITTDIEFKDKDKINMPHPVEWIYGYEAEIRTHTQF